MAISRVLGASLVSDLDRQGVDLQFTTSGNSLVYMDFANFHTGINTSTPSESLEVVGNLLVTTGNLLTSGNLTYDLGSATNWWHNIFVGNITAGNFIAGNVDGILTTSSQPNITSLGVLLGLDINGNLSVAGQITPFANVSGTIGNTSLWWNTVYANTIYSSGIYGTILTGAQYNITNLGNISVDSISIGGNVILTGNTAGGIIYADQLYDSNNRVLTEATNIALTGDATGVGTYANIPVTLSNSGIAADTYGSNVSIAQITFDSKGRAVSAANITLNKVGNVTINDTTISSTGDIVFASNIADITVSGNITANTINLTSIDISEIYEAGYRVLTTNTNIQVNGDVVGSGSYSNIYVQLPNTGVVAGVYGSADDEFADRIPKITVDSKGRITNIANVTLTQVGNVSFNDTTISANSDVTITSVGNITLDAQGNSVVKITGTDAVQIPTGGVSTRPANPETGYVRFNTDTGSIETWDGNTWTSPGLATITSETINPDGVSNSFSLSSNVSSASGLLVTINGTLQQPVTSYNTSGNLIIFTEVPLASDTIEVRSIASGVVVTALQLGATEVSLTVGNVNVTGNLVPSANVTYDLGSPTNWWRDIYLSGNTIYLGGMSITNNNGILTTTVGGNLTRLQADDPVDLQDVVTLSYLNSAISSIDPSIIQQDDTSIQIIDDGIDAGNIVIGVDGSNVAKVGSNLVEVYRNIAVTGNVSANVFTYANGQSILDNVMTAWQANAAVQAGNIATLFANAAVQAGNIATLFSNAAVQAGAIANIQTNYANLAGATFTGTVTIPTLSLTNPLALDHGGTGATTTSGVGGALDNLLPSGEQSGYILKTSGAGTYFWAAEGSGGGGVVGQQLTTLRQANTATSGQTVFTLVDGTSYVPGTGQLRVYINGVRQFPTAYTETSNVSYTLATGVTAGTIVFAEIDAFSTFNNYANLTYASNIGNISAVGLTVQAAIDSLENNKAPLASPVFTGNLRAPAIVTTGNITAHTTTSNLRAYGEIVSNVGGVSGTANIDLSSANIFDITLTNSTTFTFINHPPAGVTRPVTIVLRQPAVGGKTATFTGALYTDGAPPVLSTNNNAIDVLTFWSIDGGTTFFGTYAMANVS